ncbi:MAG: GntR family transcriptional regulator [Granulosicoccus sp.]
MTTGLVKSSKHLSSHVYDSLFLMIRERELRAGDTIVESHVSEQLGVSRTPLREAMQRLESHGLLQKGANRSFQVRRVELKEYLQSLKVREVLEAEAVVLAIDRIAPDQIAAARDATRELQHTDPYDKLAHWRADDLVHHLYIKNCSNDVMMRLILSLRVTTQLFEIERLSDRLDPDSREHELILDAIESKDASAASRHVADHIQSLFDFAVQTTV